MTPASTDREDLDFLAHDGEMAALIRDHAWAATDCGSPGAWPAALKGALRLALSSRHPMFIFWGPRHTCFYNDGYRPSLGSDKHPAILGAPAREAWLEIWDTIGPQIALVMRGEGATWHENQLVPILREGRMVEVYWTYSYGPIHDEDAPNRVGGVLVICTETTRHVQNESLLRRREAELARAHRIARTAHYEVDLRGGIHNERSPEYLALHGLPPAAARETHEEWLARVHPDDRRRAEQRYKKAIKRRQRTYAIEYRIIRPSDGETRWISVLAEIDYASDGSPLHLFGTHTDITERRRAEEQLRDSERRQGLLLALNDALRPLSDVASIAGTAARTIVERLGIDLVSFAEISEDADRAAIFAEYGREGPLVAATSCHPADIPSIRECLRAGRPFVADDIRGSPNLSRLELDPLQALGVRGLVTVPFSKDGFLRGALSVGAATPRPWSDSDVALLCEVADRTWAVLERARAELALRSSEERLRLARDAGQIGVWDWDAVADRTTWDDRQREIYGVAVDFRPEGDAFRAFVHPDDLPELDLKVADALRTGASLEAEFRIRRTDGEMRWLSVRSICDTDLSGRVTRMVGVTTDITARRRAEAALKESDERYRSLFQTIDEGFALCELIRDEAGRAVDYRCIDLNPALEKLTGLKRAEIVGRRRGEAMSPPSAQWMTICSRVVETGQPSHVEDFSTSLGRWLHVRVFPRGGDRFAALYEDVTERKRAEVALKDSEARYRAALRVGRIGSWETDLVTGVRTWSPEAMELFGLDLPDGRGVVGSEQDEWRAALHPADRHVADEVRDITLREDWFQLEYRIRGPGGSTIWLLGHGLVTRRDPDGRAAYLVNVAADITDRKLSEERLRASEERFRVLAATVPSIVWTAAADGSITYANEQWFRYVGITPQDNARGWPELVLHPDDRERCLSAWARALATGEDYEVEVRNRRHDGAFRWFLTRASAVKDATGAVISWFGVTTDIDDQKVAEAALREREAQLRIVTETIQDAFYVTNVQDRSLVFLSPAYERIWGRPRQELFDDLAKFLDYLHPDDRSAVLATYDAKRRGEATSVEYRITRPDGEERVILDRSFPVTDASGRPLHCAGLAIDITDRKRAERHQRLLIRELNHRVKNTLATVVSIAGQTLRDDRSPDEARENFTARLVALARAHDVLTRVNWDWTDLRDIVSQAIAPHASDSGPDRFAVEGPPLRIAPRVALAISMALHELLTNAVKYGALKVPKGRIGILWKVSPEPRKRLFLMWREQGGPPVAPPTRKGFGSRLVEHALASELEGNVVIDFAREGVTCTIDAPLGAEDRSAGK